MSVDKSKAVATVPTSKPTGGGRGGSAVSVSSVEGRNEESSFFLSTEKEDNASLSDVLLELGVFALSRPKRGELATRLVQDGVTVEDLRELHAYLSELLTDAAHVQRTIVGKLLNRDELPTMIEDLRKLREVRSKKRQELRNEPASEHYWGFPSPISSCNCDGCQDRRAIGYKNEDERDV